MYTYLGAFVYSAPMGFTNLEHGPLHPSIRSCNCDLITPELAGCVNSPGYSPRNFKSASYCFLKTRLNAEAFVLLEINVVFTVSSFSASNQFKSVWKQHGMWRQAWTNLFDLMILNTVDNPATGSSLCLLSTKCEEVSGLAHELSHKREKMPSVKILPINPLAKGKC